MTALTGLLDGETAEALKGLYGVQSTEAQEPISEEENSWSNYEDRSEEASYCDLCAEECPESELREEPHSKDMVCGECDRRANTHAVDRFRSTSDDLELE